MFTEKEAWLDLHDYFLSSTGNDRPGICVAIAELVDDGDISLELMEDVMEKRLKRREPAPCDKPYPNSGAYWWPKTAAGNHIRAQICKELAEECEQEEREKENADRTRSMVDAGAGI